MTKSTKIKCNYCGNDEFFVDTLGIEHCSKCFGATMYITNATGRLSYKQLDLEEELEKNRVVK